MESDVEVWVARLPNFGLDRAGPESPAIPESAREPGNEVAAFDYPRPDSFVTHPECRAVLIRDMHAVRTYTKGRASSRVLKANPDVPWPQPPWRRHTTGTRISLLVRGTAWFDIDGAGEVAFSANDSWCLTRGVGHGLLEASSDFELLEIELAGAGEGGVKDDATPDGEMYMLYGSYSYRPITRFGGHEPPAHGATAAAPDLPADERISPLLHVWDGYPWHFHDHGIQCGYVTSGSARIEVQGFGIVDADPGTFWFQQL
jgi:quercetin dioxygenase-like cupin family protein